MSAETPAPEAPANQPNAEMGPSDWMDVMAQDEALARSDAKELVEIDNAKVARADEHEAYLTNKLGVEALEDDALKADIRKEAEEQARREHTPTHLKEVAGQFEKAEKKNAKATKKQANKDAKDQRKAEKELGITVAEGDDIKADKREFVKTRLEEEQKAALENGKDLTSAESKDEFAAKAEELVSEYDQSLAELVPAPKERFGRLKAAKERFTQMIDGVREKQTAKKEQTREGREAVLRQAIEDKAAVGSVMLVVNKLEQFEASGDKTHKQVMGKFYAEVARETLRRFDLKKFADAENDEAREAQTSLAALVTYVRFGKGEEFSSKIEAAVAELEQKRQAEQDKLDAVNIDEQLVAFNPQVEEFFESPQQAEVIDLEAKRREKEIGRMRKLGAAAMAVLALGVGSLGLKAGDGVESPAYANAPAVAAATEADSSGPDLGTAVEAPSDAVLASASTPAVETEAGAEQTPETYTVQEGDSIWNIAKSRVGEGASNQDIANEMARIIDLNEAELPNPDVIFADQELKV